MTVIYNIFAYREGEPTTKRHFLVESVDEEIARALFIVDRWGWEIELSRPARCFASDEKHEGELSVWDGKKGRTAVLCQYHGETPPQ